MLAHFRNGMPKLCLAMALLIAMACGGGGGTSAPSGGTGSGSGSGNTPSSTEAPAAIYPIQHHYRADPVPTDNVPETRGLAYGDGRFWFMDGSYLQSYDPATGAYAYGRPGFTGSLLLFEQGPCVVGGGIFPMVETLVDGRIATFDLYQVGGDYGWPNSVTSDGQGHLYIVCEGHRTLDSYPARGATLLKYDLASHAVTAYPFRSWGPADDARVTVTPYSSVVLDKSRNAIFILSYYHQDITRIDLGSGQVDHFTSSDISVPGNVVLDGQGGVYADQGAGLVHLSSQGTFSMRNWPGPFHQGTPTHDVVQNLVVDDNGRVWAAGADGTLVCMPPTGAGKAYQFSYVPGGSDGWLSQEGLLWCLGRLWLTSRTMYDPVGNLLEFQLPPTGSLPAPSTPSLSLQPTSLQVGQYQKAHLETQATGNGTLTYQWMLNGMPIPWATSSFYDVPSATGADAGVYVCQVTNTLYGKRVTVQTAPASLSLIEDPSIAVFTTSASRLTKGQPATLTAWFVGGVGMLTPGNLPLSSGIPVMVAPSITTTYQVKVTNSLGIAASAEVTLQVDDPGMLITSFTASPTLVDAGQSTSLAWFVNDASTRLALQDDLGLVGPLDLTGASVSLQVPRRRQTYILSASLGGTAAAASVRVGARGLDLLAGHMGGQGELDGQGTDARMSFPGPMAVRSDGTLVFADSMDPVIRQVTPEGLVTTLCGQFGAPGDVDGSLSQARFTQISGLAITPDGTLYVLDHGAGKLKRVTSAGQVSTVMSIGGGGTGAFREDMASDATGNLYIPLELENRVVKVTPTGTIATVASNVSYPRGVALQPDGTLYALTSMGGFWVVRPDGTSQQIIPLVAGGEPGGGSKLFTLSGISTDSQGAIYVSSASGVYALDSAYEGHPIFSSGSGWNANEQGLAWAPQGFLWISHTNGLGYEMLQVVPGNPPSVVAGLSRPYSDPYSSVAPDLFDAPCSLAHAPGGTILVGDTYLGVVRSVGPTGITQDIPLGTKISDLVWAPLWCDGSGRIYFSIGNSLCRFDPHTGQTTPLVYSSMLYGIADGGVGEARVGSPRGMVGDLKGNLYFLDTVSESDMTIAQLYVRKLGSDGALVTLAGGRYGFADGTGADARFASLRGIALEPNGNLLVVDQGNHAIRRVTPQGVVTTVAGGAGQGYKDGPSTTALFNWPSGVAVDDQDNIFVADTYNAAIRIITPDGQVSTLVGNPIQPGTRAGALGKASLYRPLDLLLTRDGDLIVTDSGAVLQFTAPLGH